jgi:hypothetical protein
VAGALQKHVTQLEFASLIAVAAAHHYSSAAAKLPVDFVAGVALTSGREMVCCRAG